MHNEFAHVIASLLVAVGAAALTALVFQALRLPVVLGYILTGLMIGPHVSALVNDTTLITTLSELGVILLFFRIGLEFSVRPFARVRHDGGRGSDLDLFLAILTGVASGSGLSAGDLLRMVAKLGGFFVGMIAIGLLIVPRAIRYLARFERPDALVVTSLGVCFPFV
jgi:Kef-type K+ transport system membrane component KefB